MTIWKSAIAATAMLAASMTIAEARKSTLNYTCQQARELVQTNGTILLSTGRHTFDRFVSRRSFCPLGDYIEIAYVPTQNRRSCKIGYTCTMDNPLEILWD